MSQRGGLRRLVGKRQNKSSKLVDRREVGSSAQGPKFPGFQWRAVRGISHPGGHGREVQQPLGDRTPTDFFFSTQQVEAVNHPKSAFAGSAGRACSDDLLLSIADDDVKPILA